MNMPDALLARLPRAPEYVFDWTGLRGLPPLASWFDQMEKTPQDPVWHGEGDVWTHTRMVCGALAGLEEFRALPDRPRNALALAALLHDIGKVRCTRMEDGRWTAPHHAPVGARMARVLLWVDFGLCGDPDSQRFREAVCLLIRYHSTPVHLYREDSPAARALRLAANGALAPDFTLRSLCLLAEADELGRIAPDTRDRLDCVALGRETAREEGCLDGLYPFASARTRRALFSGSRVWKDQALYDDTWGEVLLMCGLPGTGKDTWIRSSLPGLPTVCLDDLRREMGVGPGDDQGRVVQAAKERAKALLRARQPFIWNATSLTAQRARQISLFESYGARARIVFLETSWRENLRRNAERPAPVPEHVILDMLESLEPPEAHEARQVDWICL